jgi:hypothetical protein
MKDNQKNKPTPYNWMERKYLWMDFDQMSRMLLLIPLSLGLGCFIVWAGLSDVTPASENLKTKGFLLGIVPIVLLALKHLRANKLKEEEKSNNSKK